MNCRLKGICIFITGLIFFPELLKSQSYEVSFGSYFGSNFTSLTSSPDHYHLFPEFKSTGTEIEGYNYKAGIGNEVGVNLDLAVYPHFGLRIGLMFENRNFSQDYIGDKNSLGWPFWYHTYNKFQLFTVPIQVYYSFGKKKLSYAVSLGVYGSEVYNHRGNTTIISYHQIFQVWDTTYYSFSHNEGYRFPVYDWGVSFSCGIRYHLSKRWKLNLLYNKQASVAILHSSHGDVGFSKSSLSLGLAYRFSIKRIVEPIFQ